MKEYNQVKKQQEKWTNPKLNNSNNNKKLLHWLLLNLNKKTQDNLSQCKLNKIILMAKLKVMRI